MYSVYPATFTAALACARFALASPIVPLILPNSTNQIVATIDCYNLTAAFSESCWDTLDIADYLGNSQTGWVWHVPACDPTTSSGLNKEGCCDSSNGELWSTCYLRLGRGLPGADCSTISPHGCSWDEEQRTLRLLTFRTITVSNIQIVNSSLSTWEKARARYVIWNIVSINNFFDTYFTGE